MITNQFCLHFDTNFHRKFTQCDKISIQLFTENSITKTKHPFNYSQKIQSLKQNIHSTIHRKFTQCDKISIQLFTENSITKTKYPSDHSQKNQSVGVRNAYPNKKRKPTKANNLKGF
jgi:hypothetical protein